MADKELKILHIDTDVAWRGGQQQTFYLHNELVNKKIYSLLVCNKNSIISQKCKSKNLPFVDIKILGEIDLISAYRIAKICKKKKINIIQCHSGHAHSIGLLTKIFFPHVKLISVRRVDFHIKKNKISLWKYNSPKVNKIICVSDAIKKVLIEDYVIENKLITIHDGIDINRFTHVENKINIREKYNLNRNEIIIGTVAAFAGHKDYPNFINAAKIVIKKTKNVTFFALGSGQLKSEMENLVTSLGIKDKFIFGGFQKDVPAYLKEFNIFILSSKLEGLGTSILDALASGIPVIATKTGGIPEVIEHRFNGILVEPENHIELAYAIIDLLNNPNKQKQLSENANKSIEKFSIEKTVEENIKLYRVLLGSEN